MGLKSLGQPSGATAAQRAQAGSSRQKTQLSRARLEPLREELREQRKVQALPTGVPAERGDVEQDAQFARTSEVCA